jgi:hypothetical protein
MRIAPLLIVAVCITMSSSKVAQAQEVSRFIKLFNERKMDEITNITKGYISPNLLKYEKKLIIRPLVIVTHKQTQTIVDNFYNSYVTLIEDLGKTPRENDLMEYKREHARLEIGWKDLRAIAKEAEVELVTASYRIKGGESMRHILVIFASDKQVLMVKTLSKASRKADTEKRELEGRETWIYHLKELKKKIEQPDAGVQSEGAPSD